jgi:hypothetical protein
MKFSKLDAYRANGESCVSVIYKKLREWNVS